MGANFGAGAHFFGHRKRALEQLVQGGAQGAHFIGGTYRVFHLAQDLGFTQHHRIQAARHPKGVASGIGVFQGICVGVQVLGRHATRLGQPVQCLLQRGRRPSAINLGAVASGENGGFALVGKGTAQTRQGGANLVHRKGKLSPHVQRSCVVIEAQGPDCHDLNYKICTP